MASVRTQYRVVIRCLNCGHKFERYVNLGVTVDEYVKKNEMVCSNCECPDARLVTDLGGK